jgi:predicted RNase H-like HicB family nuclease
MAKIKATIKTKYGPFVAVFEPEPDMGGYMVTIPRIPSAFSWGKNLAHAKKMGIEVIECAIEGDVLLAAEKAGRISLAKGRPVFA